MAAAGPTAPPSRRPEIAAGLASSQRPPWTDSPRWLLPTVAAIVGFVLLAQVPLAIGLLDADLQYEAGHAKPVLLINGSLAVLVAIAAAILPARFRALALLPGGALAAATLVGALTVGGHLWDFGAAALTLAAASWLGAGLLRLLRAGAMRGVAAIEVTAGLGVIGLVVLLLGRLDAIAWWNAGVLVIIAGLAGSRTALTAGWARRRAVLGSVTSSRIGTACAGLLLLQTGWLVVWLSAPEIMYDPLFSKTYLPDLWARTGAIEPLLSHPQLNLMGLAQVVAVPGHALGSDDVGRELQLVTWATLAATVWWWGRRSVAGPLAALAVGIAPQVVWQATTAFDDLLLATGAVALALAVLRSVGEDHAAAAAAGWKAGMGPAIAFGLLAGTCVWLKLHLAVIAVVLTGGWVLASGPLRRLPGRLSGVVTGALVIAGPAFALRWIDTGNPVFPTYNSIFKSPHYPPIDEAYNFPFWPQAGFWDLVKLPYEATVHPFLMSEAAPAGSFGLLVAAAVLGVLLGWRGEDRRSTVIVWIALVSGLLVWWVQFRYLRYAMPAMAVAVVLVLPMLRWWRPGRVGTAAALTAAALASATYLPSTVATFWNVPGRDLPFAAAFGRWGELDYLRTVFPEKDALAAYARVAPPGAGAVSDAHQRLFVPGRGLSPKWEVDRLLLLSGPPPVESRETLRRLRGLGLRWALVTGANRTAEGATWLPRLLAAHGEPAFADRGWDLYRLVEHPQRPRMLPDCDPRLRGRPGCWEGTLDTTPGLRDGESAGGMHRSVRVCAGQTVAVQVTTERAGAATQVSIDADSGDIKAGHNSATVPPGRIGWVYGTAPTGTGASRIAVMPGVGGTVSWVRIGVLGRCAQKAE
jgi:hypothetical protein